MTKTAKPFSKAAETKLLGAAKEMTAHVEENGLAPDEAIAKVASEHNLPRDWVPLLVQAHNHGRTTYQRDRTGPDILDKVAEFPLASTEGVMAILYPDEIPTPSEEAEKTAVSTEYSQEPSWAAEHYKAAELAVLRKTPMEKAASAEAPALQRDPDGIMTAKFKKIAKLASKVSRARQESQHTKVAYLSTMGALADWFKGRDASVFAKHAFWAEQLFGPAGKHAMSYVRLRNRMKVGKIQPPVPDGQPVTSDVEPYSLVKAAIDAGAAMVEAKRAEAQAEFRRKLAHDEVFAPFVGALAKDRNLTPGSPNQSSKEANLLSGIGGGLGFTLARGMQGTIAEMPGAQSPSELASSLMNDLADPEHEQALRQIQVRSMLTDLMSNDEVISGYEPDEIIAAYNEIASLSPRAAMQPAVMRPLLRKRLVAGSVEPFEAQQMAEIEKTITESTVPSFAGASSPARKTAGVLDGNPILAAN